MLKLNQLSLIEDSLVIEPADFPNEEQRSEWVSALLNMLNTQTQQEEVGADLAQYSFMWGSCLFILSISDTVDSIWINATNRNMPVTIEMHDKLKQVIAD
ncbi:DUF3630 family protein [Glaciecola sp. 2405UD65-10]|jgi:hypothetical protein|uniref:DUF3630 family protein n=1 Tax=Glaciecola sp. 2405UD65-10 TaxID=3397244 RepID=UPI003B5B62BB